MPSVEANRQNGRKSNGPKTFNGKQICSLAVVEHGIRSWSPVLPGETEADWAHLLTGCRESLQPVGVPEEQLVYNIAMTFLQMHRLHRREREVSFAGMKVDILSDIEKQDLQHEIGAILDGRGAELRLEISRLENLIEILIALETDSLGEPLSPDEAKLLLDWIVGVNVSQKHLRQGESIVAMPAEGWTRASLREAIGELALALSKSTETLIDNTIQRATLDRDEKRAKLRAAWHYIEHDSLPKPETATLLDLYDRRLLNRLTRLYNVLERLQASRMGKPVVPTVPVDVTITRDS